MIARKPNMTGTTPHRSRAGCLLVSGLLGMAAVACGPARIDLDGDRQVPPDDCNDGDATVYQGAAERCDDRDSDCDGRLDDPDAIDARRFYPDLDGDGSGAGEPIVACSPPPGYVSEQGDCDDGSPLWRGATHRSTPGWLLQRCGAGAVIEAADDPAKWGVVHWYPGSSSVQAYTEPGCAGAALAFDYRIDDPGDEPGSLLLQKPLDGGTTDLGDEDWLLFSFAGSPGSLANVELKMVDERGCQSQVSFEGGGALPALRTVAVSLRQFTGVAVPDCPDASGADLRAIDALIVGVSSDGPTMGTLHIDDVSMITRDELAALAGSSQRWFECPYQDSAAMARITARMAAYQDLELGVIPTWYGAVGEPLFQTASEALGLLALTLEAARRPPGTGDAADRLAATLVGLQDGGAWAEAYRAEDGALEPATADSSVAHTAWTVIALEMYRRRRADDATIQDAEASGAAFLAANTTTWTSNTADRCASARLETGGDPVDALEAFETWFALTAAGRTDEAGALGDWIDDCFWDEEEERYLISPGVFRPALDVTGAFGAIFRARRGDPDTAFDVLRLNRALFPATSWTGPSVTGMADAYAYQPSVERTAMYAAAGGEGASYAIGQLLQLERDVDHDGLPDGELPGAVNTFDAGADGYYTAWTGLSVSAWVYLAMHGGVLQGL
jgi:hypothetical protein